MTFEVGDPRPKQLRWWNLACISVISFVVIVTLFDAADGSPHWAQVPSYVSRVLLLLIPAALFLVLYFWLGRRSLLAGMADRPVDRTTASFLVLLLIVLAVSTFFDPMYAMLQALAYPMVWTIMPRYRDAVLASLAIAVAIGIGLYLGLAGVDSEAGLLTSAVTAPISFIFAVVMGTWISRIHAQGERYRELATQLRESQARIASLSEAAGAATERERISRDLHDTLTQTLAGLVMLSEQMERALDAGDERLARDRLDRVASAARNAVSEARALVATTQPIGSAGLNSAIERVAAGLRADTGLSVDCSLAHLTLDREREVVLLRAVQEGLANARKHARATHVTVALSEAETGVAVLVVEDDGVGPGVDRPGGFGLAGLGDRVRAVGGEMRFGPRRGGGSRLEVHVGSRTQEDAAVMPEIRAPASKTPGDIETADTTRSNLR